MRRACIAFIPLYLHTQTDWHTIGLCWRGCDINVVDVAIAASWKR